jgi:hypothetical protein
MNDTLIKADNFGIDWIKVDLPFPCEIHWLKPRYDPNDFNKNNSIKVLFTNSEPSPWCISEDEIISISKYFDLIIGKKNIEGVNNLVVLPFGGSFIKEAMPKEFGLSNLLSMGAHGSLLPGHLFRIAVTTRLMGIDSSIYELYKSNNFDSHLYKLNPQIHTFTSSIPLYPYEFKDQLFKKTHNIAIENNAEYNYFTEKLIDCFRTFTIPIYWGCTNIGDHFDTRGMIIINDLEAINDVVNNITINDYLNRIPYLSKNYELSKSYWDVLKNLKLAIQQNTNFKW